MASTYRDSAGVERPTQWERVDPDGLESSQVLTPKTLREIVDGQSMVFDDPLMSDVGASGWCAGLARERERAVLAWWRKVQAAKAEAWIGMARWTPPRGYGHG